MSLVNTETGELLDSAAAERRAERIRLRLDAIADNYQAVLPMIREAIEKRDDLALGYRSPGEYVADRFGGALENLGIEVRREVVRELTEAGMSTRAIAPVVGVSDVTVHRDVKAGASHVAPAEDTQAISGGTSVPPDAAGPHHSPSLPSVATMLGNSGPNTERKPGPVVVGIDGKTYTRPASRTTPSVDRRRTDVVAVINKAILKAEEASEHARQIKRDHLRPRTEEAAVWGRRLFAALEDIEALAQTLKEVSE